MQPSGSQLYKREKEEEDETSPSNTASTSMSQARPAQQRGKKPKRSSQACIYCQKLKMKCSGSFPCERCLRVGKECKIPEYASIRQPWTKKKDQEIEALTDKLHEMERRLQEQENLSSSPSNDGSDSITVKPPPFDYSRPPPPPQSQSQSQSQSSAGLSSAGLSSAGMFKGKAPIRSGDISNRRAPPFVASGRITMQEAKDLYQLFMHNCVLHVCVLDPEWHTFARISRDSPFLLACVIYIGSTYHPTNADLRTQLTAEMNEMIGKVITSGEKNVSIVQAFLFLYFFNQPPEDSNNDTAWVYSGIAIRIATELNLSTIRTATNESLEAKVDRERTWLMTFVVDRSLSMTRGHSWTIRGDDDLVRNSLAWSEQSACRSWDVTIGILAELLKITSRQIDALNSALSQKREFSDEFDCETMLRLMNEELEEWRTRWTAKGVFRSPLEENDIPEDVGGAGVGGRAAMTRGTKEIIPQRANEADMHKRTYHYLTKQAILRFNYAILVLNCFGLQYCAMHPNVLSIRLYSVARAIKASQNILRAAKDELKDVIAYAPHSQCTIVTFGILSLIKLASLKREDQVVSQRLLTMAKQGIDFLQNAAIRPNHVTARSASFLRGLLRKSLSGEIYEARFKPGMDAHNLPSKSSRPNSPTREAMSISGDIVMTHHLRRQQQLQQQQEQVRGKEEQRQLHYQQQESSQQKFRQTQEHMNLQHQQHEQQQHHQDQQLEQQYRIPPTYDYLQQQHLLQQQINAIDPQLQGGNTGPVAPMQQINHYAEGMPNTGHDAGSLTGMPWTFDNEALSMYPNTDATSVFGKDGSTGFGGLTTDELLNDQFWLRMPPRNS